MSGPTLRRRTGVIFALVAFVLGVSAAAALGWAGGEPTGNNEGGKPSHEQDKEHGKNKGDNGDKDKDHGKNNGDNGDKDHGNKPPKDNEENAPPTVTPGTPQTPSAPVTPQGAPTPPGPGQPVTPSSPPSEELPPSTEQPPTAAAPPSGEKAPPLAPAAERKKLASTGLDPALIALAGAFFLVGGGFLFRRALARS
jgi:hypothetical protein